MIEGDRDYKNITETLLKEPSKSRDIDLLKEFLTIL